MKNVTYQVITDHLISKLESGVAPWRKTWSGSSQAFGSGINAISKKQYRGVNALLTSLSCFDSNEWATFKQWQDLGGMVRKGEKSTPIFYFSKFEKENEAGEKDSYGFAKYFRVFNRDQIEGLPVIEQPKEERKPQHERIEACEVLLDGIFKREKSLSLKQGGDRAAYSPLADRILMPKREAFEKIEEYYGTLFHELGHSTGHESRLAREGVTGFDKFGSHQYSKEELIAEITAAFLCAQTEIDAVTIDNSAAYLAEWLKVLKNNDPRFIVQAASAAQKAADLLLGKVETVLERGAA